ncbi:unnamed protein product, partial [marine sediment metagenome]
YSLTTIQGVQKKEIPTIKLEKLYNNKIWEL